jgi:hypothetical protein
MKSDEQVSKNLELAGRFFEHVLDHPSELDALPDGVAVILVPDDDEELAEANMAMAQALMRKDAERRAPHSRHHAEDIGDSGGILLQPVHS